MPFSSKPKNFSLLILTLAIASTAGLIGCSKAEKDRSSSQESASPAPSQTSNQTNSPTAEATTSASISPIAMKNTTTSATADTAFTLGSQVTSQQNSPALAHKKLVVTANATFEVEDVVQSVNKIEELAVQNGGYIADSRIDNNERGRDAYAIGNQQQKVIVRYIRHAEMVLRVPKNQVSAFLQALQTQVKFLENSQFSAKDVTLELKKAELEAQIQASKQSALEKQALENKTDKTQAGNVALIEQSTLAQQERAYAELQQQSVQDQIELSTIALSFDQPEKIRTQIEPDIDAVIGAEKTQTFGSRLLDNLNSGWLYFMEFLLGLANLWVFIVAGLGVFWLIRLWHRRTAHLTTPKFKNKLQEENKSQGANGDEKYHTKSED